MGSGPFPLDGFINIDQFEHVHPDLICDCTKLPYELGSVDEIYAGHILEHFHYADGINVLQYWKSLLRSGGVISITVPDYDYLVKEYAAHPTPAKLIEFNNMYIYSGIQPSPHKFAYSAALLKQVMEEAGFVSVTRMPVDHPYFPSPVEWQAGFTGVNP
jgi:predicted SAM-dependent methyltransferase